VDFICKWVANPDGSEMCHCCWLSVIHTKMWIIKEKKKQKKK
jgi:hypothetical protein